MGRERRGIWIPKRDRSRTFPAVRDRSAYLTAPRAFVSSLCSPRLSLGWAGTLACPVPHGAAPTPDSECTGNPLLRQGFRPSPTPTPVPSAASRSSLSSTPASLSQAALLSPSSGCPLPRWPLPALVPISGSPPLRVSALGWGNSWKAPRRWHLESDHLEPGPRSQETIPCAHYC